MTRDTLRQKVYDAEFELRFYRDHCDGSVDFYGSTLELPAARKFGDLAGVQRYVEAVYGMAQVQAKYPRTKIGPPTVRKRQGNTHAHYERWGHVIAIPDHLGSNNSWAMDEVVVLHETAHSLVDNPGHGTEFVLCFLDLLEWCMNGTWRLLMTRALDTRGVPLA